MIKRIIEISSARTYLSVKYDQLVIKSNGDVQSQIPCEDIGILLIDHVGTMYTHAVFTRLLDAGAAIVLCGGNHHPAGLILPLESHSTQTERFRQQIEAKVPVKKRLWKQLVQAKIKHQARVVGPDSEVYPALLALRQRVRSGDPQNVEAQASRKYWGVYLQDVQFRRNVEGKPPNNLLNYGYTIMRAAVARALCSAGLLPSLGLHHRNRYNAFCLADDLVEPFRGYVDARVKDIVEGEGVPEGLNQNLKARLLEILYETVTIGGNKSPLMVSLHRTMASLQRCFTGEQDKLELPDL